MATTIPQVPNFTGEIAQRTDPTTFAERADPQYAYQAQLSVDLNTTVDAINIVSGEVETAATEAEQAASTAAASANFVGRWDDATGSATKGSVYYHNGQNWQLLDDIADITASEPSNSNSEWLDLVGLLKTVAISVGTTAENVTLATNTTDAIVGYIYDADEQVTYSVPVDAQGKFIAGVVGGVLTASNTSTYTLTVATQNIRLKGTATARTIADRFGNTAELEDFASLASGDDWTLALNAALATGKNVRIPPNNGRVFGVLYNLTFAQAGQMLFGDNRETTELTAISLTHPTSIVDVQGSINIVMEGITLNGNKANRPDVSGGMGAFIKSSGNHIKNCVFKEWPNSGVLLDGGLGFDCNDNHIEECLIADNDGVGISQSAARFTVITKNTFERSGLENLTIDTTSFGCKVTENYFKKHYGGCGCIGWDESDDVLVMGNTFDGENAENAEVSNRVAICWNAQTGPNLRGKIIGNSFVNYPEFGIKLRDRTLESGFKPGSGVIQGNTFTGMGEGDIQIPELAGILDCKSNGGASLDITADNGFLRLDSAAIKFDAEMSADMTLTGDATWVPLVMDSEIYSRECEQVLGVWNLPVSGTYSFYGKIRLTGLPVDATFVAIGIRVEGSVTTELLNYPLSGESFKELTISPSVNIGAGDVSLIVRMATTSGTSTCVVKSGGDSSFQVTYIG